MIFHHFDACCFAVLLQCFLSCLVAGYIEHLEDALGSRQRALHGLPFLAQCGDGVEETPEKENEGGQGSQADLPAGQACSRPAPQQ